MKCQECGHANSEYAVYCGMCNEDLRGEEMTSDGRFCASCGRKVDSGSRLCPHCGHDSLESLQKALQLREEPIGLGVRILLYLLSLTVPLAGFIIGAVFLTRPGPEHQRVGKICLILAVFSILLSVILAALLYVLVINFGLTVAGPY